MEQKHGIMYLLYFSTNLIKDTTHDPEYKIKGKPEVCAEINPRLPPLLPFYLEQLCFYLSLLEYLH